MFLKHLLRCRIPSLLYLFSGVLCLKKDIAMTSKNQTHFNCRNVPYPKTNNTIKRQTVPSDKISWDYDWPDYTPPSYTAEHIKDQPWADPDISNINFKPEWNALDGNVNRKSFIGTYKIKDGYPLNPVGRTGLRGRGLLGRWGPNHAADPIVTRWKIKDGETVIDSVSLKPVLQFVGIKRKDCNEWAIPGGMVDPGENVTTTLKREFVEEALSSLETESVKDFFKDGIPIYNGYVDDIRNTDNAWIETTAYNFHDDEGSVVGSWNLAAASDAVDVTWLDVSVQTVLYASHSALLKLVSTRHGAHW